MARVTFRETYEEGNYLTGEYRRWTREVEFEGESHDLDYLIRAVSSHLKLPAVETKYPLLGSYGGNAAYRKILEEIRG